MTTRSRRLSACSTAAVLLALAAPVAARAQAATYSFDIPSQDLGAALRTFGQTSHQQIAFDAALTQGRRNATLNGAYTADEGLRRLLAGTGLAARRAAGSVIVIERAAELPQKSAAAAAPEQVSEMVVTGSRIRRASTDTAAPVTALGPRDIIDRGYTQVGEALNAMSSVAPSTPLSSGSGTAAGSGQQFPNLFGLGAGRTLTLVNGRRFVTSASGLGDRVVDTNLIPTGLVERIDVVQAGGAAVYGSDAIAGVINFVLKKDFEGVELDAQYGESSRGDYPRTSFRATVGRNFADGRGNVAVNLEWSKTRPLYWDDRPETGPANILGGVNPANTSGSDGISSRIFLPDTRFWQYNYNGVVSTIPAPVASVILNQFSPDGNSLQPFNLGKVAGVPFASGGDGFPYGDLAALYAGVQRTTANAIGHYDLSDHMKVSGELLYGRTRSNDPYGDQGPYYYTLNDPETGHGAIPFFATNAFLTPGQVTTLTALSPSFGAGAPLFLSKQFRDLVPTRAYVTTTDNLRAAVSLDGDFDLGGRNFYYDASYSHGDVRGRTAGWNVNTARFNNAADSVRNSAGQIVCAINATTVTDAGCVPLDLFGDNSVTPAMRAYLAVPVGSKYHNTQDDFLASLGGDILRLPAGAAKFSLGFEHRREEASFTPSLAQQQGLVEDGSRTTPTSGAYHTNEFSAEVLVPVLGGDFTLPLVKALEFTGQYRRVDNSLAGKEDVWGGGVRWEVVQGLTLRGSRSRNFRAPSLDQLLAPSVTALGYLTRDPCDQRYIDTGTNPAVRRANCAAVFAAHPGYNSGRGLATFQGSNAANVLTTTSGNPNLRNEISDTTTWGFVLQPPFVPGLTLIADRIKVSLTDGLSAFSVDNFAAACYDSAGLPANVCSTFARGPTGQVVTGVATTFNAGSVKFAGETYNASYRLPLDWISGGADWGRVELGVEATHISRLDISVTGFDLTRYAGATFGTPTPKWHTVANAAWTRGPLRLTYQADYLGKAMIRLADTVETTPVPVVKSNLRHNVSALYDFGKFQVRGGVINLTDEGPSFPTLNYGDILGRQYFLGVRARF